MPKPPAYDPVLWFHHLGCRGRHYLLGNPHTVPGRIWSWCPREQCTHFVSRADIGKASVAARYWIEGYLHGAEPPPPDGDDGTPDFGSKEYRRWLQRTRRFRATGVWPRPRLS